MNQLPNNLNKFNVRFLFAISGILVEYLMVKREKLGGALMSSIVVVGTQWGDEGKGKITDFLAEQADVIARFSRW